MSGSVTALPTPAGTSAGVPHSTEAEQALLGALMFNNHLYEHVEGKLVPAHFYSDFHAAIFETIEDLLVKGWDAAPLTIQETMKEKNRFGSREDVLESLAVLLDNATAATNMQALVEIILQAYTQRQLLDVGSEITLEAPEAASMEEIKNLINRVEDNLFNLSETGSGIKSRGIQGLRNPLRTVIERAQNARANQSDLTGVTSGFVDLDKLLGGFHPSDLVILAARPSMGKTALAINIAHEAATALMHDKDGGTAVGIFSLEMSADQLAARILSGTTGVSSNKLQLGQISDDDFDRLITQAGSLNELRLFIDDTPSLHVNNLRSRARRMVKQHGVGLIVVDYLQLMRGSNGRGDFNRVQEITDISLGLKSIARELDVPVIALSQLSRAVESRDNKRPQLSDLRESGSIEQDADVVMFLYREEYYLERELGATAKMSEEERFSLPDDEQKRVAAKLEKLQAVRGTTELLVSKNRKGPTGTISLQFDPATTTFHNLDRFHRS